MSHIERLRKEYDQLDPFERATLQTEAILRKDEAMADALSPPTIWDAFHNTANKFAFALLALNAIYESLRGEVFYWMSMAQFGRMHAQLERGKIKDGPEADAELDGWLDRKAEGDRRTIAWLNALEALDKETGGACMAFAHMFAGEHIATVTGRERNEEVDYTEELSHLRELWNVVMQGSPDVPKAVS